MILEWELKALCNISVSRNEWKSVLLRREFYEREFEQRKISTLILWIKSPYRTEVALLTWKSSFEVAIKLTLFVVVLTIFAVG